MDRGRSLSRFCWYFLLLTISSAQSQTSQDQAVKSMLNLLEPAASKGHPFPAIPGPRLRDKVCIIGAGPAGIHMSQRLKKLGHKNIKIFEKTNRVGGKSFDIKYRGTEQPQGTIFFEANYFDNLVPLAQEYGAGEYVRIPPYNVWATNNANDTDSKLRTSHFILQSVAMLTKSSDPATNSKYLLQTITQFVHTHKSMFGDYEGDLMPQPCRDVMHRIRGTFLEYLKREDMMALVPMFKLSHTLQGYGHLDEVSALYGLMWNNPKFMVALGLRALKKDYEPHSVFVLKDGFEKIWKNIVDKEDLNVIYNVDIHSIRRAWNGIFMTFWKDSSLKTEHCDFMIWTPPMPNFLKSFVDVRADEYYLFNGLNPEIFTANLVNMRNEIRNGPYNAFMANIDRKVEGGVTGEAHLMGLLTMDIGTDEGLAKYDQNNAEIKTVSVLQLGKKLQDEETLNKILINHYTQGFNATDVEILNTMSWQYFPRWSPAEIEMGRHWQVFGMQGRQNIWYAGSSVSFESIRGVMEYNNLLIRSMYYRLGCFALFVCTP